MHMQDIYIAIPCRIQIGFQGLSQTNILKLCYYQISDASMHLLLKI